ncbi:hypothetical protein PA25_17580 [Pseudoalteromonas sp. A25]|uniref:serine protease n=1 Tax=Pseudoalteromonas sp. A25 TaxID=116092 RepID=UPI0012604A58|nr:serine protease [Pseudoalteromonas sp. A25]BBN81773.1 hypothetical protein PA25_17580 [Pseudoalteromonas sp. A25]
MLKKSLTAIAIMLSCSVTAGDASTKLKSQQFSDSIRIVGGNEATPHSRPYQVSVQSLGGEHFCGGSLVADNLVLTAAHCLEGVNGESPEIQVRVGAHSLKDGSGQAIVVDKTYTNQEYPGLSKDVAVLKLKEKITDKNAKVIKLAEPTFFNSTIKPGTSLAVSGWGTLSYGGQAPDKLMEVSVPYVSNAVCNSAQAYNGSVQDTELCAGFQKGGKDSCQGDSGGPLVYQRGSEFIQVGVVSWGEGCAQENKYGVYANVAALKSWIDSAMAGNEPVSGGGSDGGTGNGDTEQTYLAIQETVNYKVGNDALQFVLDVPEGVNVVYIATRGGEGDVDVSAQYQQPENDGNTQANEFWFDEDITFYSSTNTGNDEMLVIEFPKAGEWLISLSDTSDFAKVELTVFSH